MSRIIGWLFVALSFMTLGADAMASLTEQTEGLTLRLRALGEYWQQLHTDSLQVLQPAIERHIAPELWDFVVFPVLQWPLCFIFMGLGLLFLLIAKRKKRDNRRMFG